MNEAADQIREMANTASEIEALLEGAVKLHESMDYDHEIALIYLARDKIRDLA